MSHWPALRAASPSIGHIGSLGLEQTREALEGVMGQRGRGKAIEFKTKEAVGV